MSSAIVMGGTGAVGSHLVRHLLDSDDIKKVTLLVRNAYNASKMNNRKKLVHMSDTYLTI